MFRARDGARRAGARAQAVETVGARALGMGGAFVAVANDSSATWWNPAGSPQDPSSTSRWARRHRRRPVTRTHARVARRGRRCPCWRASYYRLRITDIDSLDPTVVPEAGRQEGRVGVTRRSPSSLDSLASRLCTRCYRVCTPVPRSSSCTRSAEGTGIESTENHFDADIGVLGVAGPVRLGLVARNLSEPVVHTSGDGFPDVRLARHVRLGVAYDSDLLRAGRTRPFIVSLDADLHAYDTVRGPRRVLAAGAELWIAARRAGLRGGARFNQVGAHERAATVGASFAIVRNIMAEIHATAGSAPNVAGVWRHALPSDAAAAATADRTRSRAPTRRRRELREHRGRPPRRSASQREAHHP